MFLRLAKRRGYFKSLILRGVGLPDDHAGAIEVLRNSNSPPVRFEWGNDLLAPGGVISENEIMFGTFFGAQVSFDQNSFAQFVFDIVAQLKGTFEPGRLSSFHAFSHAIVRPS